MDLEFVKFFELSVADTATRNGIPRFTADENYAANFGLLRKRHSKLQLDSFNGTTDRRDTILNRTGWPADYFLGKTVLECGCGIGSDTEILLSLGCKILAVDLAGSDIAKENVGDNPNVQFVQGDITDLPLKKQSFDIVFCHRVLQHTPNPKATLDRILDYVKPDGAVFVHCYARSFYQLCRWKYVLRPVTKRMDHRKLYGGIARFSVPLFKFTNVMNRTRLGRVFCHFFVPFLNYRYHETYRNMSDEQMIEYSIHDTFDSLSPLYDRPIKPTAMQSLASGKLLRPFEVVRTRGTSLLRSLV